jgi:diguanylate cyclase (GGDEF)-like protein
VSTCTDLRIAGGEMDQQRLERRAARERAARREAERLLESKSRELFAANQALVRLNAELEGRVEDRTRDLDAARAAAVAALETDHLTCIASRHQYSTRIEDAVARANRGECAVGLLLIDVDEFKMINDTLGHTYGDELLVILSERLRRAMRDTDLVARIGGDEFAVILEGPDAATITKSARRLLRVFDAPITASGVTFQCSASVGLAVAPDHTRSTVDLQRYADLALYKVKRAGGRGIATFSRALLRAQESRQRMEADLHDAIAHDACEIRFQPIVDVATRRPVMVEALARWTDAGGTAVSPEIFIPLAEQCGLIRRLGKQLLRKSLRAAKPWIAAGLIERVSFNISPVELLDRNFERAVLRAIREEAFPANRLVLEITEGVVLHNLEAARKVMLGLRAAGVAFALDDFGSGYSNLSYLRDLPLAALKIDRALILDLETDRAAQAIIRNTVSLCRDLDISVVCEGVETTGQLAFLETIGCHRAQGFLFYRPLPSTLPATL